MGKKHLDRTTGGEFKGAGSFLMGLATISEKIAEV